METDPKQTSQTSPDTFVVPTTMTPLLEQAMADKATFAAEIRDQYDADGNERPELPISLPDELKPDDPPAVQTPIIEEVPDYVKNHGAPSSDVVDGVPIQPNRETRDT